MMPAVIKPASIFGMMAEFDTPTEIVAAAQRTRKRDIRRIDAYSPFPIEELAEAIGFHKNGVPMITLSGRNSGNVRRFHACSGG